MSIKHFDQQGVPTIQFDHAQEVADYLLIDVRGQDEYHGELGHIERSQLVTLGPDLETFLADLDHSQKIIFICRSGARSARATLYAKALGINEAFNLEGGMMLWNQQGKKVEV